MRTLLEAARSMFHAERATVTLFPGEGETAALEYTLHDESDLDELNSVTLEPTEGVWARVASERQGLLLARPITNERLRAHFSKIGVRDLMVAPLYGNAGAVTGTIMVGNRVSDIDTFTSEDLRLFETYANHVSVSLEKAQLMTRLETSVVDLQELHNLKDEFLATVSHELRTPLTSIMGFIAVLQADPELGEDERQEYLSVMERQSMQLRALIEDLLMAARLESDAVRPAATRVGVPSLARRVVEGFASWKPPHRFVIHTEDVPDVISDEETAQRILTNLVNNAVKNSPDGSTVTIRADREDQGVLITVQDEGTGIAQDLHEKIFERFYQVDGSLTRKVGGTGLGLYICRKLSEMIGGRVWLDWSEPGQGSRFAMWIPMSISSDVVPLAKPRLVVDIR
ncbi:MAG: HAMP domain-containing histidine kinase [Actinobacteria bacterium]|nr:HAMP domain-containing histidine kinase [Actinomycetota bacterium]